ncbi:MAG: hypothetical protein M3P30_13940 [Chloroflexota bacterium]|nr:hypothetical protein [Chloroflexota bacterium]
MPGRALLCAGLIGLSLLAAIACKSDKSGGGAGLIPTLAGTAIPTVSPVPPTAVVCTPPEPLTLPPSFPAELAVVIPPDMTVYSVNTTPHLQVIGRVPPPFDPNRNEPPFGIAAFTVVQRMEGIGWAPKINQKADGADWTFTAPDGRMLHFNALPKPQCSNVVQLTYDLQWLTP